MDSKKLERVNGEIMRELSVLLPKIKDPRVDGLLSITAVSTTPDLKFAKVYISVFENENIKDLFKGLKSASGFLRKELSSKLKIRCTPELIFEQDTSMEYGAKITKILKNLDVHQEEEN